MASKRATVSLRGAGWLSAATREPLKKCLIPRLQSRSMATEVSPVTTTISPMIPTSAALLRRPPPQDPKVPTTIYSFPDLQVKTFTQYPSNYLNLPLRRDILHRAIVYEGDMTRQGTASTKWRGDVHGSGRKLAPQKGRGRARVGDKKSPSRRGGGVAHGPHPRDFSTRLNKKIYDLAWRTALSYRYRKGELFVLESIEDTKNGDRIPLPLRSKSGRTMFVTRTEMPNLNELLKAAGDQHCVKDQEDVDVKDLLKSGKVVIEKRVLDWIFRNHSSDVNQKAPSAVGI